MRTMTNESPAESRTAEDLNIFMVCSEVRSDALSELDDRLSVRFGAPTDFDTWKAFPFDTAEDAEAYDTYMTTFFESAYGNKSKEYWAGTRFVCEPDGTPIAKGGVWQAFGELTTLQWIKTRADHEGSGVGRALMSMLMQSITRQQFPVFLHTQAGSVRAIKLYTDLGFAIITDTVPGPRPNQYAEALDYLAAKMPAEAFANLRFAGAPPQLLDVLARHDTVEF